MKLNFDTLVLGGRRYRYDDSADKVEVLVMKALSLGLVRGTIDQVDAQVHMQWVQPRVLSRDQIAGMKKRLDAWNADVASMEKLLETKAHEIISI
ncbi:hypothetical protein HPB51_025191 [Rhipicephalus microplus]|uniref:Rpn9 C-terminal helix domain-containing protein n=1 Tax=Rhipicephalus microplus TaxID=6941 RepID=A0A9J6E5F8_RHIMP|nr:hypothetical protein HPB51_025191 [Rhipicephalus microplus]